MYPIDYIDGDSFRLMCDFCLGQIGSEEDNQLMYCDSGQYLEALSFIKSNKGQAFRLLSHNGDEVINACDVPDNLTVWYTQNLNFTHPKVNPIPIGLENEHWHPAKRGAMHNLPTGRDRKIRAFMQLNPDTHKERWDLLIKLKSGNVFADYGHSLNGHNFEGYVANLISYAFCMCPRGNGIDTHRIWEALYLGCIPIVKKHVTHKCLSDLPVMLVDEWEEVTPQRLESEYRNIQEGEYKMEKLSFSYWKERILG